MIRLYGLFDGDASLGRVSQGFRKVFPDADLYRLDAWDNSLDEGVPDQPGATNKIGIYVGDLSQVHVARMRAKHEKLYVMVAPNSNTVGRVLRVKLEGVGHLLAPSKWAVGVLRASFPHKTVTHAPHGISEAFQPKVVPKYPGFSVLHMSSSVLERKGTDKLLEGWALADLKDATLFLSVPLGRRTYFKEEAAMLGISKSVHVTDRLNYGEDQMAALYSQMSFICQPSRGEGFGFIPLEARACGTPVIMTDCTGHSEHVGGLGVVRVRTGEDTPIDDFPGAFAPSLSAEAVAEALLTAYEKRDQYAGEALLTSPEIRKQWSWENQLKEFKNGIMS